MANNYTESSSFLPLEPEQREKAEEIIDRVAKEFEDDADLGFCGVVAEVKKDGVWFHQDEYVYVEHMEGIARAIIEELEIDEPFFASWAHTCSKPRIDEFGGGAFCIKRGMPTIYIDAMQWVQGELLRREKMFAAVEEWKEKGV